MLESKSGVLLIAGLGFFALAFLSNAVVPIMMYRHLPEQSVEQLVEKNGNLRYQFEDLARRFPDTFTKVYGRPPQDTGNPEQDTAKRKEWLEKASQRALKEGHDVYVAEGCWHCHSQFVRPVSNEDRRWGPVAKTEEYQNVLQRPVLFGTRRVGPDLSREGGRRSNDWHAVHFYQPTLVSEGSPMPEYTWLFDGSPDRPNARGLALITYVQWLGSWLESYPYYEDYRRSLIWDLEKEASR
jgi:cytochrome c oxidase cbb3-type subunit II